MEKTKNIFKVIGITALVGMVITGIVLGCIFGLNPNEKVNDSLEPTEESSPLEIKTMVENGIRLTAGVAVQSSNSITKTLTATIVPSDAENLLVDWKIEWANAIPDANISDYLTVTPTGDGSLVARVTAYQAFEGGSAIITVTTRDGGYTATCTVSYEGVPSSLHLILGDSEYTALSEIEVGTKATALTIRSKNVLGLAGSKYNSEFEISEIKAFGKFVMTGRYTVNGSVTTSEDFVFDLETGSYTLSDSSNGVSYTLNLPASKFLTASVSGNILTVNGIQTIDSFSQGVGARTGFTFFYKSPYRDPRASSDSPCYIRVYIKEKLTGLTQCFDFYIVSSVKNVTLSDSSLVF